jgi:undecaprenyl-diphosphatase
MDWLEALLLGALQGLTEFLPVSSDGHLTITQHIFDALRGHSGTGAAKLFFDVMLHFGTLVAILVYYRKEVFTGTRGLLGASDVPPSFQRRALVRTGFLVFVATLPLVPYAIRAIGLKKLVEQAVESLTVTGLGFLVTAIVLALTPLIRSGRKGPAEALWLDALLIGLAQAFAPLPGVSRSGLTVATALALGFSPAWSVGFSFLIGAPAILAANLLELKDANLGALGSERIAQIALATLLAGLVGYAALAWLVRIVAQRKLWVFSIYLFVLAAVVLAIAIMRPTAAPPESQTRLPRAAARALPLHQGVAGLAHSRRRSPAGEAPPRAAAVAVVELARA